MPRTSTTSQKASMPTATRFSPSKRCTKHVTHKPQRAKQNNVTLHGFICDPKIYMAYLSFANRAGQDEGFYSRPIDNAWDATMLQNPSDPKPLYPENTTTSNETRSMSQILNVDFWVDRRTDIGKYT